MPDLIGQMVGNYRIESLLGTGGVGQVYRARQLRLEREVAFKVLHPHFASDATFQARFLREAQAAAALNHPNIVQIHDFGEQDGLLYLVMELIEGGSLRGLLQRRANGEIVFPLSLSIDLVRQVSDALAYAHHRGMVHRDIKAENLLLDERAERGGVRPYLVKVTDFGLARLQGGHQLTSAGQVLGTPATMSPEQCRGEELDGRSDQYSLGVVLYEVVTGQLPFEIKSMTDAVYKHIYVAPPPPRSIQPNIPARLEQIILRCLEKDPAARFPTMSDLSRELQASTQPPQPGVPIDISSPTLTEVAYTPHPAPTPTPTPTPTPPQSAPVPAPAPAPAPVAPDPHPRAQLDAQPRPAQPAADQNFQTQLDQPPQPQQPRQPQWQPPPPASTPAGPMVTHLTGRGASANDQPPPIPWMTGPGVEAGSPPGGAPPIEYAGARPEPTASQQERAARPTAPMATAAGAPYRPAKARTPLLLSLAGGVVLLGLLGWAVASGRIGGGGGDAEPTAPGQGSGGVIVATATATVAPTAQPTAAPTLAAVLPTSAPATPAPTAVPTAVPVPAATTLHPSGRILFSCGRGSPPERLEICAINGDGTGLQVVTHDAVDDLTPTVSPDGKQIAFTSTRDGRNQIYVMDANGENQRRLVDSPTVDEIPTWAPVGRQIVFIRARENRSDIVVVNDDGTGLINLTEGSNASNWSPSWSPDGMQIAFVSNRNGNNEIYTVGNDGTNPRRLTTSPGSDEAPAWSPDGKQIVFISTRNGNGEVYAMNADGSNPRRLTNTNQSESDPTWSPDGSTIAFARPVGDGREIGLMNPDGDNQRQLTTGAAFDSWLSWSPDSQRLVYMSPREGNMESYVAPADGSPIIRLTNDLNFDGNPRWVPGR